MDDAQTLARKHYMALNARDFVAYGEHLDDHVTMVSDAGVTVGREASVAMAQNLVRLFPSMVVEIERMTLGPESVICELRLEGVMEVDEHGTERPADGPGLLSQIIDVRNGRIVALRTYRTPESEGPGPVGRMRAYGHDRGLTNEQSAVRHVAALAAGASTLEETFRAAVVEASALLGGTVTTLLRYDEQPDMVTVVACTDSARLGVRFPLEQHPIAARVKRSGLAQVVGAEEGSAVAAPIVVDGKPWGILAVAPTGQLVPSGTAERLFAFTNVIAAAVSSAEVRDNLRRLVDEQSALRRVAELVAHGAGEDELFDSVAAEAARLIDEATTLVRFDEARTYTVVATCGGPVPVGLRVAIPEDDAGSAAEVLRTHRAARRDDYQIAGGIFDRDDFATGSSVSVPILVNGGLWGMLGTITENRRLPAGTEHRLEQFAELVAAALANSQARAEVQVLADEQSALRRIAELVAHGAAEAELFDAVAVEAAGLVENEPTTLVRYEGERTFTILATSGGPVPPGTSVVSPAEDRGPFAQMLENPYRPVRIDDYGHVEGPMFSRERYGVASSVSVPILLDGRLWGMIGVLTRDRRLPSVTENRLLKFSELVAAALANNQARAEVRKLADEQAALRRVAELVARSAPLEEVFDAVASEASRLLGGRATALSRFDVDGYATVIAACSGALRPGMRFAPYAGMLLTRIFESGRPARTSDYENPAISSIARKLSIAAAAGVPVTVDGRVWAMLSTFSSDSELPPGTEERLEEFAGLAAAAIANAENKADLTASRARVVATADETRRRLQRDVHDGAQQRLVQTLITLQHARDAIEHGRSVATLVDEALYHAERADRDLRELVQGIMPASLSRGGLHSGLESLLADLPMPVDLELVVPRLEASTETTAYFVVAEALTNVVKHAGATNVRVSVVLENGVLVIEVEDDGAGGADPALGTGLNGLSDRVGAAEGALAITSPPGRGTAVRAELPVKVLPSSK